MIRKGPLRVGIAGPVGSGKTALVDALCKELRSRCDMAVVTNDIYTKEDAQFLMRSGALPIERIVGVETGGLPPPPDPRDAPVKPHAPHPRHERHPRPQLFIV